MRRWILWTAVATLIFAAMVHVITIVVIPYQIMNNTKNGLIKRGLTENSLVHVPLPTAESRIVVRPSPDLLYSLCLYNVTEKPLRFTAWVPDSYWSISFYASNTDNFFVMNDRQAQSSPVEVLLVGENVSYPEPGDAVVVTAPSNTGIALIRMTVPSEDKLNDLVQVQRKAFTKQVGVSEQPERAGPPAEEPTPGKLSFEAAQYTNAEYGFSVKYPKDWAKAELGGSFSAQSPARVPFLIIDVADATSLKDAIEGMVKKGGGSSLQIISQSETNLADGTPAAEAEIKWTIKQGYPTDGFCLSAKKDGKTVFILIGTVSLLASYDKAMFSEIAHTLEFK